MNQCLLVRQYLFNSAFNESNLVEQRRNRDELESETDADLCSQSFLTLIHTFKKVKPVALHLKTVWAHRTPSWSLFDKAENDCFSFYHAILMSQLASSS